MARRATRRARHLRRLRQRDALNRLLPNALTMLGLCAGLTAIRFGLQGGWLAAVLLIAAAALLDTLDGRIARLMGGPTEFGGQLDSLVDSIAFGVAPVVLIYLWSLSDAGGLGWAVTVLFAVCCVLRLARFNIASADPDLPAWAGSYFSGVPAPAAAGLVLVPLILGNGFDWEWARSPWLTGPWTLAVSLLMISRLPTYSFKRLRVSHRMVPVALAGIAVLAAASITNPWFTLAGLMGAYVTTIPLSVRSFHKSQRESTVEAESDDDDDGDGPEAPLDE
jgi:CDP-diacylglycerol--serine O-phosphatidyltransferase